MKVHSKSDLKYRKRQWLVKTQFTELALISRFENFQEIQFEGFMQTINPWHADTGHMDQSIFTPVGQPLSQMSSTTWKARQILKHGITRHPK